MDDEDDGQHSCPSCGYGDYRCDYCGRLECGNPDDGPDCAEYYDAMADEDEAESDPEVD